MFQHIETLIELFTTPFVRNSQLPATAPQLLRLFFPLQSSCVALMKNNIGMEGFYLSPSNITSLMMNTGCQLRSSSWPNLDLQAASSSSLSYPSRRYLSYPHLTQLTVFQVPSCPLLQGYSWTFSRFPPTIHKDSNTSFQTWTYPTSNQSTSNTSFTYLRSGVSVLQLCDLVREQLQYTSSLLNCLICLSTPAASSFPAPPSFVGFQSQYPPTIKPFGPLNSIVQLKECLWLPKQMNIFCLWAFRPYPWEDTCLSLGLQQKKELRVEKYHPNTLKTIQNLAQSTRPTI